MAKRVLIIQGHPDSSTQHLCHRIAAAYAEGARNAGHSVREIDVGKLDFPILRSAAAWREQAPSQDIQEAQEAIRDAQQLVLIYPLWLGAPPALFKGFLEQLFRPGFAFARDSKKAASLHPLRGKRVRIIVTMGMPGWFYRCFYGAHSLRSLKRNILRFVGAGAIRTTLFGMVEGLSERQLERCLTKVRQLGAQAR